MVSQCCRAHIVFPALLFMCSNSAAAFAKCIETIMHAVHAVLHIYVAIPSHTSCNSYEARDEADLACKLATLGWMKRLPKLKCSRPLLSCAAVHTTLLPFLLLLLLLLLSLAGAARG